MVSSDVARWGRDFCLTGVRGWLLATQFHYMGDVMVVHIVDFVNCMRLSMSTPSPNSLSTQSLHRLPTRKCSHCFAC